MSNTLLHLKKGQNTLDNDATFKHNSKSCCRLEKNMLKNRQQLGCWNLALSLTSNHENIDFYHVAYDNKL